jgi:hypothetical protein
MVVAAIHGTLILQYLNLELIYGLNSVAVGSDRLYREVRLAVAIISMVLSGVIAWSFARSLPRSAQKRSSVVGQPPSRGAALGGMSRRRRAR